MSKRIRNIGFPRRERDYHFLDQIAPPRPTTEEGRAECPSCDDSWASHMAGMHEEGPNGLVRLSQQKERP